MNYLLRLSRPRLRKLVALLYLIVLLTLTHLPNPGHIPDLPGKDKTLHVIAYFLAAVLVLAGFLRSLRPASILLFVAGLLVLGMIDEWTQPWFSRSCDFCDWLGDLGGVVLGTLTFLAACKYVRIKPAAVLPE